MKSMWSVAALSIILIVAAGCARQAEQLSVEQTASLKYWEALNRDFAEVDRLTAEGKSDDALIILQTAMERRTYRDWQTDIFLRMLTTSIAAGQSEKARAMYLKQLDKNPPLAARCFGPIEADLVARQEFNALSAWCEKLVQSDKMPEEILLALSDYQIKALRAGGSTAPELQTLKQLAPRLTPANFKGLAMRIGAALIQANDKDQFTALLEYLASLAVNKPDLAGERATLQLHWLLARGDWSGAVEHHHNLPAAIEPALRDSLLNMLGSRLIDAGQFDLLDAETQAILKDASTKQPLRLTAMRLRIHTAIQRDRPAQALERIKEACTLGAGIDFATQWLMRLCDLVMRQEKPGPEFSEIIAFADAQRRETPDGRARSMLAGLILDMSFRVEMFDLALRVIEEGVPEQKPDWHAMMINKVKAHIALKAGRHEEAYDRFNKFMQESIAGMEEMYDPITGERVTRDMVLALNEKRLAEILVKLQRADEAAARYDKARALYNKVLATLDKDSAQHKRLTGELNTIPAPK